MPARDASEAPKLRVVIAPGECDLSTRNGRIRWRHAQKRGGPCGIGLFSLLDAIFFRNSTFDDSSQLFKPLNSKNQKKSPASSSDPSSSSSSFTARVFSAPHPRTGKEHQYLLHRRRREQRKEKEEGKDEGDQKAAPSPSSTSSSFAVVSLLEASRFAFSHGSWFHGGRDKESVCSDAGVLLLTEVDPLFVALPALDSARALSREQRELKKKEQNGENDNDNNNGEGRFVDAEAAVCGGERGDDAGRRAAAALPLLLALAGGREEEEKKVEAKNEDSEIPSPSSSSSPPLSPPSPRSKARSTLLRAAGDALASICDVKSVGGDSYFRLCDSKAESWLRLKARKAASVLKEKGGPAFAGLEGEALEAAGGALVAEWLPREWSEKMGWPVPGSSSSNSNSSSRPASASAKAATPVVETPSWAPVSEKSTGPFTRDPNLPPETESFMQREERYQAAGDFAKKLKLDAAAAAREKAKAVRQDAKALAAKKEASTMKSLAGFFVVKKK